MGALYERQSGERALCSGSAAQMLCSPTRQWNLARGSRRWNQSTRAGIDVGSAQCKVDVMSLGYVRPFSFQLGRRPESQTGQRPETKVSSIRHGVTEIALSDGRLVRATLHVSGVKADPKKPGAIDVSYNVIAEIIATPEIPICDVHETIQ
jgi:hypothetical protein